MSKYIISMDMQVLNHLGLNLYSSMPAVISEVVANAWDADAEHVSINIDGNEEIIIFDNGCGMNLEDINERFLKVGYRKRAEKSCTPKHHRKVMGRKGIGKLSLFSIAREIIVLSHKSGEKNALRICTDDLDLAIRQGGEYTPEEIDVDSVDFEENGTKIILRKLKKRTANLEYYLKRRLARRFSVIGSKFCFDVSINGEFIKPEDREYISKAQFLWVYGDDAYNKYLLSQKHPNIFRSSFLRPSTLVYKEREYEFSGWLATSEEPNSLRDEDGSANRISIMVRGKMAKEDILSEFGETGLYVKYVFGEITAEFLDVDDEEDITTSNRQNFFEDDERYLALREFIKNELNHIKNKWVELRNLQGAEEAQKIKVVKEWYAELENDDKRSAQKLFGKINQLTVSTQEKKELIRHGIIAFETMKLKTCLSSFDKISPEDITAFIHAARVLDSIEATFYYKIIYQRLSVIKKLKSVTNENALEKVIQQHLAQNLWLLDPSWDRATEAPSVEETIMKQFDIINANLTQAEQDARLDIRYKKTTNRHVVIELKRANRIVKRAELYNQITKYHDALTKILLHNGAREPFEIIVLLGKTLEGMDITDSNYEPMIKSFLPYETRIMYYSELIRNAERMYSDFLEKNRYAEQLFERFIDMPDNDFLD